MNRIKKVALILAILLLTSLLGCNVVCPECPPCPEPEITVEAPSVNITPEITVEPAEIVVQPPDIIVKPQIEVPDVYVTCSPDYSSPRYNEKQLEIIVENYMRLHGDFYKPLHLKALYCTYNGAGVWTILCKFQNPPPSPTKQGSIYYRKLIFDEENGILF